MRRCASRRLHVGDLIETGLGLLDQLAESRPFPAELGRMVRRLELLAVLPLDVVHDVAAVFATMQADRDEAGLTRHEAGTLFHQLQHLGLVVGRNLHGGDLGHDAVVFADFGHVRSPVVQGDNAHLAAQVSVRRGHSSATRTDQSGTDGCQEPAGAGWRPMIPLLVIAFCRKPDARTSSMKRLTAVRTSALPLGTMMVCGTPKRLSGKSLVPGVSAFSVVRRCRLAPKASISFPVSRRWISGGLFSTSSSVACFSLRFR